MSRVWTITIEFLDGSVKVFEYKNLQEILEVSSGTSKNPVYFELQENGRIHLFPFAGIREVIFE